MDIILLLKTILLGIVEGLRNGYRSVVQDI